METEKLTKEAIKRECNYIKESLESLANSEMHPDDKKNFQVCFEEQLLGLQNYKKALDDYKILLKNYQEKIESRDGSNIKNFENDDEERIQTLASSADPQGVGSCLRSRTTTSRRPSRAWLIQSP